MSPQRVAPDNDDRRVSEVPGLRADRLNQLAVAHKRNAGRNVLHVAKRQALFFLFNIQRLFFAAFFGSENGGEGCRAHAGSVIRDQNGVVFNFQ